MESGFGIITRAQQDHEETEEELKNDSRGIRHGLDVKPAQLECCLGIPHVSFHV